MTIIEFKPPKYQKPPVCNLVWLYAQRYVTSGRGVVRLESLMRCMTIRELESLRERALSNAPGNTTKCCTRWRNVAHSALQAIVALKSALRSITTLIAPGQTFILPRAA